MTRTSELLRKIITMNFFGCKQFSEVAGLGFWVWSGDVYIPDDGTRVCAYPERWRLVEFEEILYLARRASDEEIDLWRALTGGR